MGDESQLNQIEKVVTTDNIDKVNEGLSKGWIILKVSEDVVAWEDGGKTTKQTYHLGKPKKLPI